jgi:hypothetical protein
MTREKRANGAGTSISSTAATTDAGRQRAADERIASSGRCAVPGTAVGLTRAQAEKRLRTAMDEVEVRADPDMTVATTGIACSRSST